MINEFAKIAGISADAILSDSRYPEIVEARHIYWLLLQKSGYSYAEMAQLNKRKNSTILLGIRKVKDRLSVNDFDTTDLYNKTKHLIRSKMSTIHNNITLTAPGIFNSKDEAVEDFTFRDFKCQRCHGLGYIYISDYNEETDSTCPICKGKKKLKAMVHIEWSADD